MISLISCSRNPDLSAELKRNIDETIGCEYELVVIDNSKKTFNIFQAYNEGVRRSNGDFLCFMHDDLLYHTNGWGKIAEQTFQDYPKTALLGVIGSHLFADSSSPMWGFQHISTGRIWTKEPLCETPFDQYGMLPDGGYWSGNLAFAQGKNNVPVANIDGLWMCCRSSCFESLRFDEETFGGFHCYDADLSMQALSQGWDVMVNTDILLEHFSESMLTPEYFSAADKWYNKWKDKLPIVRGVELQPWMVELFKYYTADARRYEEVLIENVRLRSTKAYRLGKALLRPLKWIVNH